MRGSNRTTGACRYSIEHSPLFGREGDLHTHHEVILYPSTPKGARRRSVPEIVGGHRPIDPSTAPIPAAALAVASPPTVREPIRDIGARRRGAAPQPPHRASAAADPATLAVDPSLGAGLLDSAPTCVCAENSKAALSGLAAATGGDHRPPDDIVFVRDCDIVESTARARVAPVVVPGRSPAGRRSRPNPRHHH